MKKKIILFSIVAIIVVGLIVGAYFIFNNKNNSNQNDSNNGSNTTNQNSTTQTTPTPTSSFQGLSEQDKSIFNSNFDMYLGKNVKGTQVKALIATIKSSNEKSEIGTVDLTINGEESMDSSKIDKAKTYSVSFEYNQKGLINKAIVEEN